VSAERKRVLATIRLSNEAMPLKAVSIASIEVMMLTGVIEQPSQARLERQPTPRFPGVELCLRWPMHDTPPVAAQEIRPDKPEAVCDDQRLDRLVRWLAGRRSRHRLKPLQSFRKGWWNVDGNEAPFSKPHAADLLKSPRRDLASP
jgi:hypothetical protein